MVDVRIPVTDVMSQALCSSMESRQDTTFQSSILIVGVGSCSTLHSFSAAPVLIAHIILIYVERLTHHFRTAFVALLSNLRLIVLLGLIAHIILIHVERLAHHFRTALVALLSNSQLIVLLGLIATLSGFSVLHFGLQDDRVQSLRKGRDRQCRTHPIHAVSSELVKIALPFYTAVGLTKGALRLTQKWQISG